MPDSHWTKDAIFYHCRRRLWRACVFHAKQALDGAAKGMPLNPGASPSSVPAARKPQKRSEDPDFPGDMTRVYRERLPQAPLELEARHLLADTWVPGCLAVDLFGLQGVS